MADCADTPLETVRRILELFGPRRAGSRAEYNAQMWLYHRLSGLKSVKVSVLPFQAPLRAKFRSSWLIWPLFALAWWLAFREKHPDWALLPGSTAAVAFFLHFVSYRHILDPLFRKRQSLNVEAILEPESGPAKRTVILSGHIDSTPEFIWWYRLGNMAAQAMVVNGALLVLFPVVLLVLWLFPALLQGFVGTLAAVLWGVAACVGAVLFLSIHGRRVVDGAQDNLSGVACALHAFEHYARTEALKNTRLVFVSFGAEETGLRGSDHYVRTRLKSYSDTPVVLNINLDGLLLKEHLNFITAEPSIWIKHDAELINILQEVFKIKGLKTGKGPLLIGATDGASFARHGYRSATLVGLPLGRLHPTYHTRRDTVDQLNGETLEEVVDALIEALKHMDGQSGTPTASLTRNFNP